MLSSGYTKKLVNIKERSFLVQILNFENGNFISVTESSEKIAYVRQGMCFVTGNFEKALEKETTKQLMDIILEETK